MTQRKGNLAAAAVLVLLSFLPVHAAENDTIQAIIPWEAEGRVFKVDTETMLFLGAMHGVIYVQSSRGEINEGFVMCPVTQKLDLESGKTEATGQCEITASADDIAYAELACEGEIGDCSGTFTLVDGAGKFAGISGSGKLRVRSPIQALLGGVAAGADVRVGSGIAVIRDLEYRVP